MADAPDPDGAKDGAKDDAAPAAATPPDQGSAMELELSQALIEVRRLTLFAGPALGDAIPRYFTEEQLRELMARLEDAQLYMRGLREENPAAATRASSPKGRAWARGTSPRRMLEQRALRDRGGGGRYEALAAEVSRRKKAEHQAKQMTAAMEEAKKAAAKRREEALERLAKEEAEELRRYEAELTRSQTLWTRGPGPAQTRPPLHQLRCWMPIYGPQGVPPLQETANGRRYPAQRLSPRPGAGQPLRSGSRANAPKAPLTRQAIQTPRYPGTIFSLTATSTSERYGGRCQDDGLQPRLLPSAEAPATPSSSSGGLARRYKPQG